jgi:6-phosphogluconolactonase
MARVTVVPSAAFPEVSAARIAQLIDGAIAARGVARVSLTGGTTPALTYAALADPARVHRAGIDWSRVHLYWGDERHVPPDHPDSNFGMADRTLIAHVPIPASHVHRVEAERPDARDAAARYALDLPDVHDVMLLGLGDDCHIASIFPGSELLGPWHGAREQRGSRQVGATTQLDDPETPPSANEKAVAVFAAHLSAWRITVTPQVILDSRTIVMLVTGANKAAAVAAAVDEPLDVARYPGQLLRTVDERVEWIVDTAAAASLHRREA